MIINSAQAGPMTDAPPLSDIVMSVLQFVLTIAGVIAVLSIVIAGIMYMTSGGNTERVGFAKKALIGGIVGLSVVLLSLIIVSTIVSLV